MLDENAQNAEFDDKKPVMGTRTTMQATVFSLQIVNKTNILERNGHIMNKKIAAGIAGFAMVLAPAAIAIAAPASAAAPNGDTVTITNNHPNSLLQYDKSEKPSDPDHIVTGAIPINGNTAGFIVKDGQNTKAASEYFTVVDGSKKTVATVDLSMKRTSDGALSVGVECGGAQCSWSQDSGTGNWTVNVT